MQSGEFGSAYKADLCAMIVFLWINLHRETLGVLIEAKIFKLRKIVSYLQFRFFELRKDRSKMIYFYKLKF